MSQHTLTVNGGPTVVYTLTGGRQGPPGPDLVADRAAIEAAAAAAAADALATAADRVQTGLDAVATAADRVQTGLDRLATGQDAAAADADATATAADRVQTGLDRTATAADRVQTGLDKVATAADRVQTGLDRTATGLDAVATAADRVQTGLDRAATTADAVATAADRVQTGTDRTTATAQAAAASASATTATAQANLAASSAASASSVAQQDLSGVSAVALHRSPNAVVAMCVYDTSKDSDGGAWVERMAHTSWYNESLNGTWRGACASEAACRAISGATTGDFFQLTTDGKFYKLNAGSGTTEVFRGNKAKFPRLAAIVAESNSVTIYDLTEPGRPMWMRFVRPTAANPTCLWAWNTVVATGVAMANGVLTLSSTGSSRLKALNFVSEWAESWGSASTSHVRGPAQIAQRASAWTAYSVDAQGISSNELNAVAMTVLPDAPVDPVTGLQVPTIACFTAGGISIIQNDGTVRNSSSGSSFGYGFITKDVLVAGSSSSSTIQFALKPGSLGAAFGTTSIVGNGAPGFNDSSAIPQAVGFSRTVVAARVGARLSMMRLNEANSAQSVVAQVAPYSTTGWMAGDIRRVWCADTLAGSLTPSNLYTGGDVASAFTPVQNCTLATVGSEVELTATAVGVCYADATVATTVVPGQGYKFVAQIRLGQASGAAYIGSQATTTYSGSHTSTSAAVVWGQSAGNGASTNLRLRFDSVNIGEKAYFSLLELTAAIADRCYKSKPATIYGTLTRTAVASAAQLVAYSGWSGSNYAQEAYSADLDPGLGSVTCSAWVNYTTAVASTIVERAAASGARIVLGTDGTGKLTATAYDGTTTRTVTTTAAYNTTTWLKARASYTTDGTLSISVNGRTVASTYGAPLLTLSNASAVCTIGNDRTLATPFPGSITLVKWGATVATQEQALWMYEQEKHMFRASAQVTLPSTNSLLDVAYDDLTDTITVVDSGNEASFTGLVRTSTATVSAGTFSKVARGSGVKLAARITTTPGVDITIPSQNLKEELKRTEDAARRARLPMTFDYVGGFTGNTTNGSTAIASVAGLSVPSTANLRGVTVTGTGIPASTVITDIVGSTVYISKAATATNTGVSISMLEFPLPTGYEAEGVATAGALKQEGSTKDWTRSFDGFTEKVVYGAAPGSTAWVQARARRQS